MSVRIVDNVSPLKVSTSLTTKNTHIKRVTSVLSQNVTKCFKRESELNAHLKTNTYGVFPKCLSLNSVNLVTKKFMTLKGFEPATSCVRDQHATTAPARHM